jgi:ribosomal protein L37AE/L43A
MDIASIVYHARGRLRLGVKSTYQKRTAISGRKQHQLRAAVCERCGRIGDIHLHHRDYTRPKLTMWLCIHCHMTQQAEDRANGMDCRLDGRWTKGNPDLACRVNTLQNCSGFINPATQF